MKPYLSSPVSIRSQEGDPEDGNNDSDIENRQSTLVSQVQFATQIPLRESPKKAKPRRQLAVRNEEPRHRARSVQHQKYGNDLQMHSSTGRLISEINDNASSAADLTQREIVVPPSSTLVHSHDRLNHGNKPLNLESSNSDITPEAMKQLLRSHRKECYEGRYVPRRLQMIPKDQAKLLESDDRWQPSLVGRPQRQGMVPLDLLNNLTRRADLKLPEVPTSPSLVDSHYVVAKGAAEPGEPQADLCQQHEESDSLSEASTEESEDVEWSPSPPRALAAFKGLPPDSPMIVSDKKTSFARQEQPIAMDTADLTKPSQISDAEHRKSSDNRSDDESPTRNQARIGTRENSVRPQTSQTDHRGDNNMLPPPSTSNAASKTASTTVQRMVQVKQTPFPPKELLALSDIPDSSTNMIPGTFDESPVRQRRAVSHLSTRCDRSPFIKTKPAEDSSDFEHDSSEDEVATNHLSTNNNASKLALSRLEDTRKESPNLDADQSGSNTSKQNPKHHTKRKLEDDFSKSYKRVKQIETKTVPREVDIADYNAIDQERAQYRREHLGKLAKRKQYVEQIISSAVPTSPHPGSASSKASVQPDELLIDSPQLQLVERNGTSITHPSAYQSFDDNNKTDKSKVALIVSGSRNEVFADLYANFVSIYRDYGGQRKHFDAACLLLKKLHLQGKATHPSLWDDFVFRHFHDYRVHLQKVMEESGNALPYEKFYEECVEQPTYLQRIVKPGHIDALHICPPSMSNTSPTPVMAVANLNAMLNNQPNNVVALNRSIAAESSISNVVSIKNAQAREEQRQLLREPQQETTEQAATAQEIDEIVPQQDSQSSRTSVKIWLERATGAESPILGTPEVDGMEQTADIPIMDLSQDDIDMVEPPSVAEKLKKRRSLPWYAGARPDAPEDLAGPKTSTATPRATASSTKVINHSVKATTKSDVNVQNTTAKPPSQPPSKPGEKSQSRPSGEETAFTRFVRCYSDLPGEKKAFDDVSTRATSLIDILAWRS